MVPTITFTLSLQKSVGEFKLDGFKINERNLQTSNLKYLSCNCCIVFELFNRNHPSIRRKQSAFFATIRMVVRWNQTFQVELQSIRNRLQVPSQLLQRRVQKHFRTTRKWERKSRRWVQYLQKCFSSLDPKPAINVNLSRSNNHFFFYRSLRISDIHQRLLIPSKSINGARRRVNEIIRHQDASEDKNDYFITDSASPCFAFALTNCKENKWISWSS